MIPRQPFVLQVKEMLALTFMSDLLMNASTGIYPVSRF